MPKFNVGDIVYCTLKDEDWYDSKTVRCCGDGEEEMRTAVEGFPMSIERLGAKSEYQSYRMSSERFRESWWFHEDDLDFFNLSLENK